MTGSIFNEDNLNTISNSNKKFNGSKCQNGCYYHNTRI